MSGFRRAYYRVVSAQLNLILTILFFSKNAILFFSARSEMKTKPVKPAMLSWLGQGKLRSNARNTVLLFSVFPFVGARNIGFPHPPSIISFHPGNHDHPFNPCHVVLSLVLDHTSLLRAPGPAFLSFCT